MRKQNCVFAALLIVATAILAIAQTNAPRYQLPPRHVIDAFDAAPLPQAILSPSKKTIALLYRRPYPTIAELSRPMLRLAGARINPKTNGPHRTGLVYAITLKRIADGSEAKVMVPAQANISNVRFSPNGEYLSFLNTTPTGIELWVAYATGKARRVSGLDRLNAASGDPCDWLHDSANMICEIVAAGRGVAPSEPAVPSGPNIQENQGKPSPAPTFEDLLKTAHDDNLFEYYFTSQLAAYNIESARKTLIGRPAIFDGVAPSPSGEYLLISKLKRPFSHLLPMGGFAEDIEVWTRRGEFVRKLADIPSREGVPINGVQTGPRSHGWRQDKPAAVIWIEAQDGGDLRNKAAIRDKLISLSAPFNTPNELAKTEWRLAGLSFTEKGIGLLSEFDRASRRIRTWILEEGAQPRKLWERRQDAAYENPGTPVARRDTGAGGGFGGGGGNGPIIQKG
ncbi:MAG: S9 family peptidase, partial [Pyrinomonadaceae bacterium]